MMKKNVFFLAIPAIISLLSACKNGSDTANNIVTKRIQYDVTIKSPDPDMEWWQQNIEGANREKLLGDIFRQVSGGKVKAYDFYSCKPLSVEDIDRLLKRTDSISIQSPMPPYELIDTVLVKEIRMGDITKLRFLEEWAMDAKTLFIQKKVAGICPMLEKHTETGELLGYQPLFWVFFDEKFPAELDN